ncbi:MAG: PEP-CTERM sorting domain-containing protein [Gemmatimonadales bacterium]|nr:PEP-CTERM sorting domain-containing protein [Gemmatimonadales bacterium]
MRHSLFAAAVVAAFVSVSAPAQAQVTIGNNNAGGNCLPFSCVNVAAVNRQQLQYRAGAFPGALTIGSIGFSCSGPLGDCPANVPFASSTFTLRLATSTRAMGGLSSSSMDSNLGGDAQLFWTGTLSGNVPTSFTINGAAFNYDPALGNLILDITWTAAPSVVNSYFDAYVGPDIERLLGTGNTGGQYTLRYGLVTTFGPGQTVVPEPGTIALLGTGLVGLVVAARRRK